MKIKAGKRTGSLMTVQALAKDLGLVVDTPCDRDDHWVVDLVQNYDDSGAGQNILIR